MENSANLVRTSRDDKPFLHGVVGNRKNFFVVGLVFMGWVGPSSGIPAGPESQNVGGTADNRTPYIISILSSPTLAKMFSFCQFQSTSYGIGHSVIRSEGGPLVITYPNN